MAEQHIPDDERIARVCTKKDFEDDALTRLGSRAFEPTSKNPTPSANWIEYYQGQEEERLDCVRRDASSGREVKLNHLLATLKAGEAKSAASGLGISLFFVHSPISPDNLSHSEIKGIPLDIKNFGVERLLKTLAHSATQTGFRSAYIEGDRKPKLDCRPRSK